MAFDLAEKQIAEGTASSQVITHFLKAVSSREQLEQERMQHEIELMKAKKAAMISAERSEALFKEAIAAFRSYSGQPPDDFGGGEEDEVLL